MLRRVFNQSTTARNLLFSRITRNFATKRFALPKFADSVEDVTVVRFLKEVGEYIEEDEEIIEVESHKGSTPIKSTMAGMISSYLIEIEEDILVNQDICEIDVDAPRPQKSEAVKPATPVQEVKQEQPKTVQKEAVKEVKEVKATPKAESTSSIPVSTGHGLCFTII